MDWIINLMNIVLPPLTFISLCLILPPYFIFKFISSIIRFFRSENMTKKVVLITGASSGIGEHIAYEYAKKGASLAIVARRESRLLVVAEMARQLGSPEVLVICADVSKASDCKRFVQETVDHFGRLDHLVNNAGINCICPFEEATEITNFNSVMDINFWGSIYPTHYAIPHLKNSNGKIVVNSSTAARIPAPMISFYCASKAALTNFYDALRMELGPAIPITIVTPGFIESEMSGGKHLTQNGEFGVDSELASSLIGPTPMMSVVDCAKSIVKGACQGRRYVTEPSWFKVIYLLKFLCPELVDATFRSLYITFQDRANVSRQTVVTPSSASNAA